MLSLGFFVNAQDNSYHFSGNLSETAQSDFLKRMEDFHFYTDIKLRYKNDSQKGELLFTIPAVTGKTEELHGLESAAVHLLGDRQHGAGAHAERP